VLAATRRRQEPYVYGSLSAEHSIFACRRRVSPFPIRLSPAAVFYEAEYPAPGFEGAILQTLSCRVARRKFIDPVRERITWSNSPAETSASSPVRRGRDTFIGIGLIISLLSFMVVGIDVLSTQWIEGMASPLFIFGTACLIAAACVVLFSIIAFVGLLVSSASVSRKPGRN